MRQNNFSAALCKVYTVKCTEEKYAREKPVHRTVDTCKNSTNNRNFFVPIYKLN